MDTHLGKMGHAFVAGPQKHIYIYYIMYIYIGVYVYLYNSFLGGGTGYTWGRGVLFTLIIFINFFL